MYITESDIQRFWSKVDRSAGVTACWPWLGKPDSDGYGKFGILVTTYKATHIALYLSGRPRPSTNHGACHTCDVTMCVQPLHLFWGTNLDNIKDRTVKGRSAKGSKNGSSKLTEQDVLEMLAMVRAGHNDRVIAYRFRVSNVLVGMIRRGEAWKHIPR